MKKIRTIINLPKTIPMTKSQVRTWIAELRSGRYLQARYRLCEQSEEDETCSFCCLGVLPQALEVGEWLYTKRSGWRYIHPAKRQKHAGTLPARTFLPMQVQDFLAQRNDNGRTFTEIAEWIERELLPLAKEDPQ